jgi:hypothetical protein
MADYRNEHVGLAVRLAHSYYLRCKKGVHTEKEILAGTINSLSHSTHASFRNGVVFESISGHQKNKKLLYCGMTSLCR